VNIQGFSQNMERYLRELQEVLAPTPLSPETRQEVERLSRNSIPGALKFVLESSRKMDLLITALLKVSRLGRVEMKPVPVDMNELLKRTLTSLRYQQEETGAKIFVASLPPCYADPSAISQLFTNLLDNAIKYRQEGRALEVKVSAQVQGGSVVYAVADNGSGIPEPDLSRIWNVFYRSERAPDKKGEGIGLPLVRRIAEKNGGSIRAESKEGAGTVFYVELPAAEGTYNGKLGQ
jgi:signal transduction histidine kinase